MSTVSPIMVGRKLGDGNVLKLRLVPAILAFLRGRTPVVAQNVQIGALWPVAACDVRQRLLLVALLDEVLDKRLVPDRAPFGLRERFESLEVPDLRQRMELDIPEAAQCEISLCA